MVTPADLSQADEGACALLTRPAADEPAPQYGLVDINQLDDQTCRWPYLKPQSFECLYCGRPVRVGYGSYCEPHAKIAYAPRPLAAEDAKLRAKSREKS